MKRQQIILIVCGVLMGVVCLGAGWFLLSAMSVRSAAAEERNQASDELKRIYNAKVFPSEENIKRVREDKRALEGWLDATSNLVHKGDLTIDEKTPAGFKQSLQATVRALSAHPGVVKGKVVESGFKFGFDKYLGESDSLPKPEHVGRLTRQLTTIEMICKELYKANILSLETITRETFEEATAEPVQQEEPRRRSNRRDKQAAREAAPAPAASAAGEFFSKQRYTFVFQARPGAFIDALNRLASMDLFVVVAETEFRKTDDPLQKFDARKKRNDPASPAEAPGGAAAVDLAKVPHVDRIVTDPEIEPPVSVKLDVDIYSFEGV